MWKLPSCSIGTDISNHGEERLHMLRCGRSGMSLILQASSAWSEDILKPTKQSRVCFNNCRHFLRTFVEPSNVFFYSVCTTEQPLPPGAPGDALTQVQWCSSKLHSSKGDSLCLCDWWWCSSREWMGPSAHQRFCEGISVCCTSFCSLLRIFMGKLFCQLWAVREARQNLSWSLHCAAVAQECTVIKSCLELLLLLFSYPVK